MAIGVDGACAAVRIGVGGEGPSPAAAVEGAEHRRIDARLARDMPALQTHYHPDFSCITRTGAVQAGRDYFPALESGRTRFDSLDHAEVATELGGAPVGSCPDDPGVKTEGACAPPQPSAELDYHDLRS